jgi:hypothetical protein
MLKSKHATDLNSNLTKTESEKNLLMAGFETRSFGQMLNTLANSATSPLLIPAYT